MSKSTLTDEEYALLVKAVGGISGALGLIYGSKRVVDRRQIFTTVVVGGVAYRSKPDMLQYLESKGFVRDTQTKEILACKGYTPSTRRADLKLTEVTPSDLNLPNGAFLSDIITAAKSHGLTLCPQDTAAAIMTQMSGDWTSKSRLTVVSPPVMFNGVPWVFSVSTKRMKAEPGDYGHHWGPLDRFLFRHV